jgi:outer membrane protein TolC
MFAASLSPARWRRFPQMPLPPPTRSALSRSAFALAAMLLLTAGAARAQITFASAVSLALNNSPRVRMAHADVVKAQGALSEIHDAYLPTVDGIMDLGYTYGAPIGEPTLFSFNAHSLVYNASQRNYARAARFGLDAANLAYAEARQEVAEDAAVTYISLSLAQQQSDALAQKFAYANRLVSIVQERLDAGQDTALELTKARYAAAQIHLQMLLLDDDIDTYRTHLGLLIGVANGPLPTVAESIPAVPASALKPPEPASAQRSGGALFAVPTPPGVAAADANASAKQQRAVGDSRYLYRPQISFFGEYNRISPFNNYQIYYPAFSNNTLNAIGIGIQISIHFFDRGQRDRAIESSADAAHAQQEAVQARDQFIEGLAKLQHSSEELEARADVADLDQQIAQQKLDATLIQLQAGTGNGGPQLSPKEEQSARMDERQAYIDLLTAQANLREAQVRLLRQNGQLEAWIKSATPPRHANASAPATNPPSSPAPQR